MPSKVYPGTRRVRPRALTWSRGGLVLAWCYIGFASGAKLNAAAPDAALQLLTEPGHVLLLRHTNAPGVGDPAGMRLDDCSTQRNLDARGRAQAQQLGERLRAAGVTAADVYTSQWCRCRDTARLLAVGPVEELVALNSFFDQPETRQTRIAALRDFLRQLPRDGRAVVLVTHQVTITALTGHFPASGAGLIVKLRPDGDFERVAELTAVP